MIRRRLAFYVIPRKILIMTHLGVKFRGGILMQNIIFPASLSPSEEIKLI
jgi:hypothetical protein